MSDTKLPEPVVESGVLPVAPPVPVKAAPHRASRKRLLLIGVAFVLLLLLIVGIPWLIEVFTTVSTDDAYVNGHVTFVAPRVAGQVSRVFVDDNNRVHKGDLLLQLDKEPYQVQVNIALAGVASAQADFETAQAEARGTIGQVRSLRFTLQRAIEDVDNQISLLRSKAAALASQKALLDKAQADYDRVVPLIKSGSISQEEFDHRKQLALSAQAQYEGALQDT